MKPLRSHRFRGRLWHLSARKPKGLAGVCEAPTLPNRSMYIPQQGGTLEHLETTLHEALHACFYDLDEESVEETARSMATLLWRLQWRKTDLPAVQEKCKAKRQKPKP